MIVELDEEGIHIRAADWKEEQVFKLYIKELVEGEGTDACIRLETYKGEDAYMIDRYGLEYIGEE
jgi:hypothetical protein